CAGAVLDDVGDIGRLPPREDVDYDAAGSERASKLADIHVHPARFPTTEGCERTGVRAQDGNSQRHPGQPNIGSTRLSGPRFPVRANEGTIRATSPISH